MYCSILNWINLWIWNPFPEGWRNCWWSYSRLWRCPIFLYMGLCTILCVASGFCRGTNCSEMWSFVLYMIIVLYYQAKLNLKTHVQKCCCCYKNPNFSFQFGWYYYFQPFREFYITISKFCNFLMISTVSRCFTFVIYL